jgi:hypothetical protein
MCYVWFKLKKPLDRADLFLHCPSQNKFNKLNSLIETRNLALFNSD